VEPIEFGPCPYCGGVVELFSKQLSWIVRCSRCHAQVDVCCYAAGLDNEAARKRAAELWIVRSVNACAQSCHEQIS